MLLVQRIPDLVNHPGHMTLSFLILLAEIPALAVPVLSDLREIYGHARSCKRGVR